MPKFIVNGGKKLHGEVMVSGSKNAALPILCACMLTNKKVILENVPDIEDIHAMMKILRAFNAKIKFKNNTVEVDPFDLKKRQAPDELVKKMRASILIM